jgi:hypothetical protein
LRAPKRRALLARARAPWPTNTRPSPPSPAPLKTPSPQTLINGFQHEQPDYWLTFGNPWEIERLVVKYPVQVGMGGSCS